MDSYLIILLYQDFSRIFPNILFSLVANGPLLHNFILFDLFDLFFRKYCKQF